MGYIGIGIGIVVALVILLRVRRLRAGDFVKVELPRTATHPLAMGTRLDAAQLLKQRGVPRAELAVLIDGKHDQELLDRYWQAHVLPAQRACLAADRPLGREQERLELDEQPCAAIEQRTAGGKSEPPRRSRVSNGPQSLSSSPWIFRVSAGCEMCRTPAAAR